MGAGTGIFTALLARRLAPLGGAVFAVEPNDDMRDAGIRHCEALPNVAFLPGTAENTGLPPSWSCVVEGDQVVIRDIV